VNRQIEQLFIIAVIHAFDPVLCGGAVREKRE